MNKPTTGAYSCAVCRRGGRRPYPEHQIGSVTLPLCGRCHAHLTQVLAALAEHGLEFADHSAHRRGMRAVQVGEVSVAMCPQCADVHHSLAAELVELLADPTTPGIKTEAVAGRIAGRVRL